MSNYDYLIVGAGPGGCVLANRLSADPARRVLLLESGPPDRHPFLHMPKGFARILLDPAHTWLFDVESGAGADARVRKWVRGRTLGGSSAVNGMVYTRGEPADYDALAALTSDDWNWAHMGRAFKAIERHHLPAAETRGDAGALRVTTYPRDGHGEILLEAAIAAAGNLGLPYVDDVNAPDGQVKAGYGVGTIHRGRRQSAATAFLKPVRQRRNLKVVTGALVDRVLFEADRAVGVEAMIDGRKQRIHAQTVILCAGALGSPAILQRSGIGPAGLLETLGVPVIADRTQVGENLSEHAVMVMQWRVKGAPTNNPAYSWPGLLGSVARYYLTRSGPLANGAIEVSAYLKTNPSEAHPNAQFMVASHSFDYGRTMVAVERAPGLMISARPLRARTKGQVRIRSRDPAAAPAVRLDYLDHPHPEDLRERLELIRFIRTLARTEPLAQYLAEETSPGEHLATDEQIAQAYREFGGPGYHAAGTCRMGADDESVVDPQTRVRGVQSLHVVDLSIAPFIVAGNTYGPVAAMAWRAADLIVDAIRP